MQEIFYPSDIINNTTTVIPDLSTPLSGETLYVSCDVYVGFQSDLLSSVTINYSDGVSAVTVERLTQMTGNTYAMHFVLDRDYYINSNYEVEEFVASGRVQTTNESIYRDFSFGINQYGSNLQYIDGAYVTFTSRQDGSTVGLSKRSSVHETLEYFVEQAQGWRNLTTGVTITVNSGECVYVRGILTGNNTTSDYTNFSILGDVSVSGNCNAIWSYNDLNADLYQYCGNRLFSNCSGLTDVENLELPAAALAPYCYSSMFSGCSGLTTAPELPATALASYCYQNMFGGCSSLITAPELPAMNLADGCYNQMFFDCSALTLAPELPATILAKNCYTGMFIYCTSLTTAPELHAMNLTDGCYGQMFGGCSSLNYIKCLAIDISASNCTINWVSGVASSGTFVKHPNVSESTWTRGFNGIPSGWTAVDCPKTLCITNIDSETTSISLPVRRQETEIVYPDVKYSKTHGQSWEQWDYDNDNITLQHGECVYIKGNNPNWFNKASVNAGHTDYDTRQIYITGGLVEVSGNVMGLLDDGACTSTTIPCMSCFMDLFGCGLVDVTPTIRYAHRLLLPATSLKHYAYSSFFRYNIKLLTAPVLPAANLSGCSGCYNHMFNHCESLIEPPALPATILGRDCYGSMFYHCHSLKKCPELPAENLTYNCYALMFGSCTSIIEPPELIATTLAEDCYYGMFSGCINLEYAPKLLATTTERECYSYMFRDCKKITKAPDILATELVGGASSSASGSCQCMFSGCTALKEIMCLATSGTQNENKSTERWMYGVPDTGVFIKHPNATWGTGVNGIKSGWTVYDFDNYIVS